MSGMDSVELRQQLLHLINKKLVDIGSRLEFNGKMDILPPMLTLMTNDSVRLCEAFTGNRASCVTYATEEPFVNETGMPSKKYQNIMTILFR